MNFWFQGDFIIDTDWLFELESMDPDQLVSTKASWSGSTLFSKISNTFLILFSNKMLIFRAGIHKILVRIANREDPDQTASFSALFV